MGPTYIFLTTAKSITNFYNCPKIHNVGSYHRHVVTNKKSQMTSYFLHTPLSPLRNVISFLFSLQVGLLFPIVFVRPRLFCSYGVILVTCLHICVCTGILECILYLKRHIFCYFCLLLGWLKVQLFSKKS